MAENVSVIMLFIVEFSYQHALGNVHKIGEKCEVMELTKARFESTLFFLVNGRGKEHVVKVCILWQTVIFS